MRGPTGDTYGTNGLKPRMRFMGEQVNAKRRREMPPAPAPLWHRIYGVR